MVCARARLSPCCSRPPIRTKADHKAALKLVSRLVDLDLAPRTPDGDLLDVMSTLVAVYDEAKHFSIEPADAIEAIKFRVDQQGLAPRDLEPMIGSSVPDRGTISS